MAVMWALSMVASKAGQTAVAMVVHWAVVMVVSSDFQTAGWSAQHSVGTRAVWRAEQWALSTAALRDARTAGETAEQWAALWAAHWEQQTVVCLEHR